MFYTTRVTRVTASHYFLFVFLASIKGEYPFWPRGTKYIDDQVSTCLHVVVYSGVGTVKRLGGGATLVENVGLEAILHKIEHVTVN